MTKNEIEAYSLWLLTLKYWYILMASLFLGSALSYLYIKNAPQSYTTSVKFPFVTYELYFSKLEKTADLNYLVPLQKNYIELILTAPTKLELEENVDREIKKIGKLYSKHKDLMINQFDDEARKMMLKSFPYPAKTEKEKLWRENSILELKIVLALVYLDSKLLQEDISMKEILLYSPFLKSKSDYEITKWNIEKNKSIYSTIIEKISNELQNTNGNYANSQVPILDEIIYTKIGRNKYQVIFLGTLFSFLMTLFLLIFVELTIFSRKQSQLVSNIKT